MTNEKFFNGLNTKEEIKAKFKELALKFHPDRGGNNKLMAELNRQYQQALKYVKSCIDESSLDDGFISVLNKIAGLNLDIELCGQWLWIGGYTKQHKDILKEAGCFWASKKKLWYWRPEEAKTYNRNTKTIDQIRIKYGSKKVNVSNKKSKNLLVA